MIKKNKFLKILSIILAILLSLTGIGFGYIYYKTKNYKPKLVTMEGENNFNNENNTQNSNDTTDLQGEIDKIDEVDIQKLSQEYKDFINVLIVGLDKRDRNDKGRADGIMILSINTKTNKVKVVSIMRDSYVYFSNKWDKINHSYSHGGIKLLASTIQNNFHIPINYYCVLDFFSFAQLIDKVGGVELNVKKEELKELNRIIYEDNTYLGFKTKAVQKEGLQLLNGEQAMAYSRIRKIDGDGERTNRQRIVFSAFVKKVKTLNEFKIMLIAKDMINMLETNFSIEDIGMLLTRLYNVDLGNIEEKTLPIDGHGVLINKVYYLKFDINKNREELKNYLLK